MRLDDIRRLWLVEFGYDQDPGAYTRSIGMLESVQRLAAGRSNLDLTQAIAVGPYPAPCFDGWQSEKEHRRFLRHLALDRIIRLVDSAGNALNVDGVFKGVIHYKLWYVDEHNAQVILERIETEAVRRKEERRIAEERAKKAAEDRAKEAAAERKRKADERKARCVELKAAGLWLHPQYKTLKAARDDGFRRLHDCQYGGEQISLKGYTLVRNPKLARSKTWWKAAGYSVKAGQKPHCQRYGPGGWFDAYRDDQVQKDVLEFTPTAAGGVLGLKGPS